MKIQNKEKLDNNDIIKAPISGQENCFYKSESQYNNESERFHCDCYKSVRYLYESFKQNPFKSNYISSPLIAFKNK